MTGNANQMELQVQYDWSEAAEVDAQVATQFLVQIGMPANGRPDGVHLVVGNANPPVVVGDDEEARQEQWARYGGRLPVKIYGRYFLSRARVEELRNVLNDLAEKYDALETPAAEEE